jgi:hypothetical protein
MSVRYIEKPSGVDMSPPDCPLRFKQATEKEDLG